MAPSSSWKPSALAGPAHRITSAAEPAATANSSARLLLLLLVPLVLVLLLVVVGASGELAASPGSRCCGVCNEHAGVA
jgi:hypothetical protein